MFILRLISQPKVEKKLLSKYHVYKFWGLRTLLNNMITKFQCDDGVADYVLDTVYQLKSLKMRCVLDWFVDNTISQSYEKCDYAEWWDDNVLTK